MPVRTIEGMKQWKEKRAEYMRMWHKMNRQRAVTNAKLWREKNPEKKHEINNRGNKKWRTEKHDDYLRIKREGRERMRQKIREFFGNKCVECGNSDFRVLQIDHVNCDGYKVKIRKTGGIFGHYYKREGGIWDIWKLIRDDPETAKQTRQLLCANCNWIKRYEMKEFLVSKHRSGT
jgi:hypothetical protein